MPTSLHARHNTQGHFVTEVPETVITQLQDILHYLLIFGPSIVYQFLVYVQCPPGFRHCPESPLYTFSGFFFFLAWFLLRGFKEAPSTEPSLEVLARIFLADECAVRSLQNDLLLLV